MLTFEISHKILPSKRQSSILGLNLIHLLAKNKLDEFHTELELIPLEQHTDLFIKHPIQLEQVRV
jgi:26S proteasome regulatory subunit N12